MSRFQLWRPLLSHRQQVLSKLSKEKAAQKLILTERELAAVCLALVESGIILSESERNLIKGTRTTTLSSQEIKLVRNAISNAAHDISTSHTVSIHERRLRQASLPDWWNGLIKTLARKAAELMRAV